VNPFVHVSVAAKQLRARIISAILSHQVRARNPTMNCHPSVVWNYPLKQLDALTIGRNVTVMAFCEMLVFPTSKYSAVRGALVIGDGSIIATGVNIRAAGGVIRIGAGSGIGQHSVLVATNHRAIRGVPFFQTPWDDRRTGVTVGDNVWVGANCVLVAGVTIGDNSLIAAGSVVTKDVPPNEIWGGIPARFIKAIPEADEL
jgi:acetyltransferase-like isoleucine patch superfamily enzyme